VADVGAVKGINDDGGIAGVLVDAAAAPVGIRSEIADVNEGVTFRTDVAGGVDPCADANAECATGFGR
jgi:hypothetical protein